VAITIKGKEIFLETPMQVVQAVEFGGPPGLKPLRTDA